MAAQKIDATAELAPVNMDLFRTTRSGAGRAPTVLDKGLLKTIHEIIEKNGGMQGFKTFTSDTAQTDAYNDARASAAIKAGTETPARITVAAMAEKNARKDAARFTAYANASADSLGKAASLRVRNEGTEDHPQARWGFVLVSHRAVKAAK